MEEYAAGGLAASGEPLPPDLAAAAAAMDAACPGTGVLAVRMIVLVRAAAGAQALDAMEQVTVTGGRGICRGMLQLALDMQADAEAAAPLPGLAGADGEWRGCRQASSRAVTTLLGEVRVRRVAYRSRKKGVADLHWRDAVLNLPACRYSWGLQELAVAECRAGSYEDAGDRIEDATGVRVGKRQLEGIVNRAAGDAEAFARGRPVPVIPAPSAFAPCARCLLPVLVLSADGKGVLVRPDALRRAAARKAQKRGRRGRRLGTGEKPGNKRIAEAGAVFDSLPHPGGPRTPEHVLLRGDGEPARSPRAVNRWYTCGIAASCADVIADVTGEACRRDPGQERHWLALVDGANCQIGCFQAEAARRGKTIVILIDFIHVYEYLWKAALAFTTGTGATAGQATAWGLGILRGRPRDVITDIQRKAAADPPEPGGEHEKNIRKAIGYLQAKEPYLDYPAALARGWPIATGVIEGACRHLIGDRLGITGARWSLPGAQAMLWIRAIAASDDAGTYWNHHIRAEHHRNHLSKYQDPPHETLQLAA